jgi:hypothetical protein
MDHNTRRPAMKAFAAVLACTLTVVLATEVDAQERRHKKRYQPEHVERSHTYRSSTVDRNGLCRRDTGRPGNTLNLNHQCDREEFWARFNDLGDSRN